MASNTLWTCDGCGKETRDYYATQNWLVITPDSSSSISICMTKGRREDKGAVTWFRRTSTMVLFCTPNCLKRWLSPEKKLLTV